MQISREALSEFISICEAEHGVRLEEREALLIAKRLLMLYELMHRIPPREPPTPPADVPVGLKTDRVPEVP